VICSEDDRLIARASPAALAHLCSGGAYVPFDHLLLLDEALSRLALGEGGRLIVSMPPRHGKSETVSRYLPAWYLGRFPDRRVMLASYEAHFAATWGRKARELLEQVGPEIFGVSVSERSAAASAWDIAGHRGGMVTAGVGGPLTGKGAHLLVIDDPVKNAEEAPSEPLRQKAFDWWRSTARTRLERGGAVVIVMTRWHEDDLAGRILAHEAELSSSEREGWEVLELPAVAEEGRGDALGRSTGEALCPELGFDSGWAQRTRAAVGGYWWASLYQQRPRPAEGMLFRREHFRHFRLQPATGETEALYVLETDSATRPVACSACTHFQTADPAASTRETADYTVVSTWAVTPGRELLLVDRRRQRFEALDVGGFLERSFREQDWPIAFLGVEDFGHGLGVIQELGRRGLPIRRLRPDTDKVARALVAVARYEEHRVFHPRGAPWLSEWEEELLSFPNAAHDDQVDTVAYAARELRNIAVGRGRRRERRAGVMAGVRDREF
jgi:predicted phage terminase large subunit-like protein